MLFNNPYSRLMAQSGVTPQPQPGPMSLMMPAAMGPAQPSQLPVTPMTPAPPGPVTQAAYDGPNVGPMMPDVGPPMSSNVMPPEPYVERQPRRGGMMALIDSINNPGGLGGLGGMTFDDDPVGLGDQFMSDLGWLGADLGNMLGGFGGGGPVPWGPSGQVGNVGMVNDLFDNWGAWMG